MSEPAKRGGRAKNSKRKENHNFFVVGIGASAGGIHALEEFFAHMPPESGMAFVVILHLSPEHESNLAEMLQRRTAMKVTQVTENRKVEPNHVYVIPPAKHLVMVDGHVGVLEPAVEKGRRVPIDLFFRTLAQAYKAHAVGVVLSGTGTDGTLGLRRIKEDGGISLAQDPQEAQYEGMVRSAIEGGVVDFILPVAQIPGKILSVREASEAIRLPPESDKPTRGQEAEALRDILAFLRVRTGHDFSNYKQSTILRRVTRRMQVNTLVTLTSYLQFLRNHPGEVPLLLSDLLITVTNFFRDREAFDVLGREVVPKLFEGKSEGEQVRVWVTGCATGEEAYSLAMLLQEHAERLGRDQNIQIFATDIDEDAIHRAREGVFPDSIQVDVTPERLKRFFTREGQHYRIKKEIRDRVLFAPHNILRDPPFSKLDLVSCRNLLIYLNRETQEHVLDIFHFSLRPNGYLFLGASESAENLPELFAPVDKKFRVFKRSPVTQPRGYVPTMPAVGKWEAKTPAFSLPPPRQTFSYDELHRALLEQYAPPSVLVNEQGDIVHLSDNAGRYLQFSGGVPTRSILKVVHPDLRLDLRGALFASTQDHKAVESRRVSVSLDGQQRFINLIVRPVTAPESARGYRVVIFDEADRPAIPPPAAQSKAPAVKPDEMNSVLHQLEDELQRTKDQLRTTVEQYETSTEELRASNEELQAINEELRSTTEELETSKEELQSVNEELTTVNHELKDKVEEVSRANSDLQNLLAATQLATVFLDRELRIKRYTPSANGLFNLIPSDIGRPLAHLTHRLEYHHMSDDAETVLQTLERVEREVRSADGDWFIARMVPYRTLDDRIDGVVLTFVDITERKRAEESVAADLKDTQLLHDLSTRLVSEANIGVIYGELMAAAIALTRADAGTVQILDEATQELVLLAWKGFERRMTEHFHRVDAGSATSCGIALATGERTFVDFDVPESADPDGSLRMHLEAGYLSAQSTPLVSRSGSAIGMLSTHWRERHRPSERELRFLDLLARQAADLLERRQYEDALRESEEQFRRAVEDAPIPVIMHAEDGQVLQVSRTWTELIGYSADDMQTFEAWLTQAYGEGANAVRDHMQGLFKGDKRALNIEFPVRTRRGEVRYWSFSASSPGTLRDGRRFIVGMALDITERKRAEEALSQSESRLQAITNLVPDLLWSNDATGETDWYNQGWLDYTGQTFEEAAGYGWLDVVHPDDRENSRRNFQTAIDTGKPLRQEYRIRNAAGEHRWFLVQARPMRDEAGRVLRWFGAATDIHEQRVVLDALRQSESRLRLSEERLHLMMDSVTDYAIFITDTEGRIERWNIGAEHLFGWTEAEAVGQMCDIIFTPEDREASVPEEERRQALEHGRAMDERWHLRKDGSRFYVSGVMSAIRDGEMSGFVKIARDLTERLQVEEELRQAHERLEEKVKERTGELENSYQTLQQEVAERRAAESQVKELMLRIVGAQELERRRISRDLHDHLGQQLTALRLNLESLKSMCGEQAELCGQVEQAQQIATRLDADVDFLAWELRPAVLNELGLDAALESYVQDWSKHFNIKADFHSGGRQAKSLAPEVENNLYRIAQEALNNIAKHAGANHVDVILDYRNEQAVLVIEDNGRGFDLAAEMETNKGLGITGMRERAALVGGVLDIETEPDAGTTIFVRVPIHNAEKEVK